MRIIYIIFFCVFSLMACSLQRKTSECQHDTYSVGLLIDISNINQYYYFIKCKEIFDTTIIINNLKVESNIDTGISVIKTDLIKELIMNNHINMVEDTLVEGSLYRAMLVEISYEKIDYLDLGVVKNALPLKDTVFSYWINRNYHKINDIKRYNGE